MALRDRLRGHNLPNAFYAVAIGVLGITCSFNFFSRAQTDPYQGLKAVIMTPKIPVGGPLVVEISGERKRLCGVWVGRGFVNVATGNMVHQDLMPAGFAPLGPFSRPVEIRLPTTMGPGKYIFKGVQWNDCGSEVFTTNYPDVPFEIVNQD